MKTIIINEVGPRDGLQNQKTVLTVEQRIELINIILSSGIRYVEAGSFVSPKAVPAMANTDAVLAPFTNQDYFSVLIANLRGFVSAIEAKAKICNFVICSTDIMNQKNVGKTVQQLLTIFDEMTKHPDASKIKINAYLSTAWDCPFHGRVSVKQVCEIAEQLNKIGAQQIILSDSIGSADPTRVKTLIKEMANIIGIERIGCHFHDTRSLALANIYASLEEGVTWFDSAIGGLGGCPFAPGASGNVATEDVLYLLHAEGYDTGVDINKLIEGIIKIQNDYSVDCSGGKNFQWLKKNHKTMVGLQPS